MWSVVLLATVFTASGCGSDRSLTKYCELVVNSSFSSVSTALYAGKLTPTQAETAVVELRKQSDKALSVAPKEVVDDLKKETAVQEKIFDLFEQHNYDIDAAKQDAALTEITRDVDAAARVAAFNATSCAKFTTSTS